MGGETAAPRGEGCARRYSTAQKRELLEEYAKAQAGGETMDAFAVRHGVSTASLCKWRRRRQAHGDAGLEERPNPRNASGPHRGPYTPEQRRAAVEAFLAAGQPMADFARLWGVSRRVFSRWVKRWREQGPKGLEPKARVRRGSARTGAGVGRRLAAPIRELVERTKRRFGHFGLKKVAQHLLRFHAVKVSTGGIRRVLEAAGLRDEPPRRKVRRAASLPRRFERAGPNELWQTDVTSFLIGVGRQRERAYLTVFLDDHSRYVVSFALHLQQKSELVIEALKDGLARFGKPKEVLSDQGRQYFAWRGKSEFQRLLHREGIRHVVARSHHPQTVGKCERLWETVKVELLDRVQLQDLADGRTRLAHFFAHYNHFRPHQGIEGLVPADRFFGVQAQLKAALEAQMARNELALALEESPPPSVFLFGQVGDEQIALHGERGRVVVTTSRSVPSSPASPTSSPSSETREVARLEANTVELARVARVARGVEATRSEATEQQENGDGHDDERDEHDGGEQGHERGPRCGGASGPGATAGADATVAQAPLQGGAADATAGAGAVGGGERGAAQGGAPDVQRGAATVAGEDESGAGGGGTVGDAAADVAAGSTGARGDGGGTAAAAADASAHRQGGRDPGDGDRSSGTERGAGAAQEGERAARAAAEDRGGRDRAPAGAAGEPCEQDGPGDGGTRRHEREREREGDGEGGERDVGERGGDSERPGARREETTHQLRDAQIDSRPKCVGE